MSHWKWSNGEKPMRTPRSLPNQEQEQEQEPTFQEKEQIDKMAVDQSLISENDAWMMPDFLQQMGKTTNKREDVYNKISERENLCTINQNPFLSSNNYLEDVMTQNNYLKPIDTNDDRYLMSSSSINS